MGELYYNFRLPSALASVQKLYSAASKSQRPRVKQWLRTQKLYTATFPRGRNFVMNPYLPMAKNMTWELDLAVMDNIKEHNQPFRYILVAVDIFDKYCWAEMMEKKTMEETTQAFSKILDRAYPRVPRIIRCDSDGAFLGATFQTFAKARGIKIKPAGGSVKAAIVERLIRTIKAKLYRIFYFRGIFKYTDILQKVVDTYNKTRHSSIGLAPAEVTHKDTFNIWHQNYMQHVAHSIPPPKFKVGDYVRLSVIRASRLLERGYLQAYTNEIFRVVRVQTKHATGLLPRPLYHVKDLKGEPISTGCYAEEMVLVSFKPNAGGEQVEKIVSHREVGKRKDLQFEVKFEGSEKTRFVSEAQLRNLM